MSKLSFFFTTLLIFLAVGVSSAEEHRISMKDWVFSPSDMTVMPGDKVVWVNDDNTVHNIAFEKSLPGAPGLDDPAKIRIGKEFSLVFEKEGVFPYVCKIHEDQEMKGLIRVRLPGK